MKRKLSYTLNKFYIFYVLLLGVFYCGNLTAQNNYPTDADAELQFTEAKFVNTGYNDFSTTFAKANFYNSNPKTKKYNFLTECGEISLAYIANDTSYKYVSTTYSDTAIPIWKFTDLTDSTTIIQYSVTLKPLVKLNNFIYNQSTTINRGSSFSYNHPTVTADSIVYFIGTDSLSKVRKRIIGSSSGITFTSTELSVLGVNNGTSVFSVIIYNSMPVIYNSRKYYFINNSMFSVVFLSIN